MTAEYNHANLPRSLKDSLLIQMVKGISYDQAKQRLEEYGLIVFSGDVAWKNFSIIKIGIPSESPSGVDAWITRLHHDQTICRIELEK